MANTYKSAQAQGTAGTGTYTTLYSTGSTTSAIVSTLFVCNTGSSPATYRVGVSGSAGTPAASEWLYYDATVEANDTLIYTFSLSIAPSKFIRVSSSANTVSFTASLVEVS